MSQGYHMPSRATTLVHVYAQKMHIFEEVNYFLNCLLHLLKNMHFPCMCMHKGGNP